MNSLKAFRLKIEHEPGQTIELNLTIEEMKLLNQSKRCTNCGHLDQLHTTDEIYTWCNIEGCNC